MNSGLGLGLAALASDFDDESDLPASPSYSFADCGASGAFSSGSCALAAFDANDKSNPAAITLARIEPVTLRHVWSSPFSLARVHRQPRVMNWPRLLFVYSKKVPIH